MDEAVRRLAADSGVLLALHGRRSGAGFEALAFKFEHGTLRIDCDADIDEIVARVDDATGDLPRVDDEPLGSLVGKVIELAWTLTHSRGFVDGFQLRCIDLASRIEASAQLEAAAGVLMVARVSSLGGH